MQPAIIAVIVVLIIVIISILIVANHSGKAPAAPVTPAAPATPSGPVTWSGTGTPPAALTPTSGGTISSYFGSGVFSTATYNLPLVSKRSLVAILDDHKTVIYLGAGATSWEILTTVALPIYSVGADYHTFSFNMGVGLVGAWLPGIMFGYGAVSPGSTTTGYYSTAAGTILPNIGTVTNNTISGVPYNDSGDILPGPSVSSTVWTLSCYTDGTNINCILRENNSIWGKITYVIMNQNIPATNTIRQVVIDAVTNIFVLLSNGTCGYIGVQDLPACVQATNMTIITGCSTIVTIAIDKARNILYALSSDGVYYITNGFLTSVGKKLAFSPMSVSVQIPSYNLLLSMNATTYVNNTRKIISMYHPYTAYDDTVVGTTIINIDC